MITEPSLAETPYTSAIKIASEGLVAALREAAPRYASGKLVDLGCGTKPYSPLFAPHIASYFGVDYKPAAETNYGSLTAADLYADCTETGLEGGAFDTLLSTQVIEHVYDTGKFVKECHRLLKKGGVGLFTIPMSWRSHAEPYDYYRFTKFSIEKIFSEAGFETLELKETEGAFAAAVQHLVVFLANRAWPGNIFFKAARKALYSVLFPVLNFSALKIDKVCRDEKFCLNFLLVVKKK